MNQSEQDEQPIVTSELMDAVVAYVRAKIVLSITTVEEDWLSEIEEEYGDFHPELMTEIRERADEIWRRAKAIGNGQDDSFVLLDPEYMEALIDHAKHWVAYGKASAKEWLDHLRKEGGDEYADEVAPHLEEIWTKAGGVFVKANDTERLEHVPGPNSSSAEAINERSKTVGATRNLEKVVTTESSNPLKGDVHSAVQSAVTDEKFKPGKTANLNKPKKRATEPPLVQNAVAESVNKPRKRPTATDESGAKRNQWKLAAASRIGRIQKDQQSRYERRSANQTEIRVWKRRLRWHLIDTLDNKQSAVSPPTAIVLTTKIVLTQVKLTSRVTGLTLVNFADRAMVQIMIALIEVGKMFLMNADGVIQTLSSKDRKAHLASRLSIEFYRLKHEAWQALEEEVQKQSQRVQEAQAAEASTPYESKPSARADSARAREDHYATVKAYRAQRKADNIAASDASQEVKRRESAEARAARKAYLDYLRKSRLTERSRLTLEKQRLVAKLLNSGQLESSASNSVTDSEAIRIRKEIGETKENIRELYRLCRISLALAQEKKLLLLQFQFLIRSKSIRTVKTGQLSPVAHPDASRTRQEIDALRTKIRQVAVQRNGTLNAAIKLDRALNRIEYFERWFYLDGPKPSAEPKIANAQPLSDSLIMLTTVEDEVIREGSKLSIRGDKTLNMTNWTNSKRWIVAICLALFLFFVWPTPYIIGRTGGSGQLQRVNRFTGVVEHATEDGWMRGNYERGYGRRRDDRRR